MLDRLIFSPGCLSSSDLKISFNFFHLGGKSCKVSLQAQAGVKSKAPYHPKQSPPRGRAPQPALMGTSLHLHTCLLSLDHFDFCSKGKVPFPFCLGQDLGCEPCKLCLWLTTSSLLSPKCGWVQSREGQPRRALHWGGVNRYSLLGKW